MEPEGTVGNGVGDDRWLRANETVLWEGRSAAEGPPIAPAAVLLFILLQFQAVLAFTCPDSPTSAIVVGGIEVWLVAGSAALVAWGRSHDRYVVTDQRAVIVRRNRGVINEAPITSAKLSIHRTTGEQTGTVEWAAGKSSGARSVAEKLGLLDAPNVTFSRVEDPGALAILCGMLVRSSVRHTPVRLDADGDVAAARHRRAKPTSATFKLVSWTITVLRAAPRENCQRWTAPSFPRKATGVVHQLLGIGPPALEHRLSFLVQLQSAGPTTRSVKSIGSHSKTGASDPRTRDAACLR